MMTPTKCLHPYLYDIRDCLVCIELELLAWNCGPWVIRHPTLGNRCCFGIVHIAFVYYLKVMLFVLPRSGTRPAPGPAPLRTERRSGIIK
jgi:hypothetical protein